MTLARAAIAALLFTATASVASAQPKALFRAEGTGHIVIVLPDPPLAESPGTDRVRATVYRRGEMIPSTLQAPPSGAALAAELTGFSGPASDLLIAFEYPNGTTRVSGAVSVGLEITTKIIANDALCSNLSLNFETKAVTDYTTKRLKLLVDYIGKKAAKAKVDPRTTAGFLEPNVTFETTPHANPEMTFASVCFELDGRIPVGNYDLSLTFPADAPVELLPMVLKTDLKNAAHANAPMSIDPNDPAKRGVEQNFDAGIQFASSVKTNASGSTRTNAGTLDLRIAPLLNVSPTPSENSTTFFFWTPILLNAKISTGDVTTDTLSSNRVVIASEVEWRYFATETTYPTYYRFLVSGRSASDRDFDRVEVKGSLEWQPVFGALTRPLAWKEKVEPSNVDPNPQREAKRILVNGVGWQLLPRVGFETGRTVKNNRPELAIEKSDAVYRLFLGGTIGLDLSRFVSLSLEDTLYLRGEVDDNQARNYLKAKAEIPLMGFTTSMAQSIFFTYERGGLPPFSTPDVDALKLGYRVQWDGWFGQVR